MKNPSSKNKYAAELLGSMFLVMASISSMVLFTAVFNASKDIAVVANALSVGFVLIALIEIFAPVSGAHFNPVVTLIMLFECKIDAARAVLYIFFQILGGMFGVVASHLMFYDHLGFILQISENSRHGYPFFSEIFGTFILVLAILLLVKHGSQKISIIIGLLVGGQLLATSSTMFANPQVTFARMFSNTASGIRPTDAALFVAMQIIGALLAYVIYRLFFAQKSKGGKSND
ncbi:MAG: aquaporin family protein [Defluviitaleaceae bacterium]|nr:aquaporin family protein [Defluviitaleaceae bacterium]